MSASEIDYYRHLSTVMYKTRGSRFTAASSLAVRERWSIATTAALSIFVLSWSVVLVSKPEAFSPGTVRFFGGLSIIASISILVLSLLDYAFGRALRAEKLQQNALRISLQMRELERELCRKRPDLDRMRKLAGEYEIAVAETGINHAPSDFKKWKIETEDAKGLPQKAWKAARLLSYNIWYYVGPLILHIAAVLLVLVATIAFFRLAG